MRYIVLILLTLFTLTLTACSYSTDFVVINDSANPVEVQYKVKNYPGSFAPPATPSTITSSQLDSHGGQQWKKLNSDQYQIDVETRTVIVRLMPHEALLVASMHNYGGHEDAWDAKEFPIDEIAVSGSDGELRLAGQQARITFSEISRALYTLTYK